MSKKNLLILSGVLLGLLIICVITVILISGMSQTRPADKSVPTCVTVSFGDDASTEKNFCWITNEEHKGSHVQYIIKSSESKPDFDAAQNAAQNAAQTAAQTSTQLTTVEGYIEETVLMYPIAGQEYVQHPQLEEKNMVRHRVYITGLEPNTEYWYRAGDMNTNSWSETAVFKTAMTPQDESDYSFLYVTDTQGFVYSDFEIWSKLLANAYSKHADIDFLVHAGDFVENYLNARQWYYVLNMPSALKNITTVPVSGNKDTKYMMNYFTLGSYANREPLVNGWYSFDYGKAHFTILYTGDNDDDLVKKQLKWLKNDLETSSASAEWNIVIVHKAPYSDANHADDSEIVRLREQLMPVFDEYGVDIVIQGHDHYFFRSEPVSDGLVADCVKETKTMKYGQAQMHSDCQGTIYFINGSAGVKQYSGTFREMPEIYAAKTQRLTKPSYTLCSFEGESLVFYTYTVNTVTGQSELLDAFGIEKG